MADAAKLPSLTVLSGPMAGTQFLIEDAVDNILIGSDPSCRFCLDVEGVSPIHARLWVDLAGITVYDTNSPAGVFVNDDRVSEQSPLHNGDVLWLGRPGDETSTMMQCRVPTAAEASAAAPIVPAVPAGDPTSTVAFMSPFAQAPPEEAVVAEVIADEPGRDVEEPTDEDVMTSTIIATAEELGAGVAVVEPEIEPTLWQRPEDSADDAPEEGGIEAAELEPESELEPDFPASFDDALAHALPPIALPPPVDTLAAPEDDEDSPTVMMPAPRDRDAMRFNVNLPRPSSPPPAEQAFEEDIDETMVMSHPREMEPTVAQRPSARPLATPPLEMPFDDDEASPTVIVQRVEDIPQPAPPPRAVTPEPRAPEPPPPAPPPPAPAAPAPVVPAPVVPRAPAVPARPTAPSVVEPARPAAPRPAAVPARPSAPMVVTPPGELPPAKKSSGSGMAIGLGLVVVAAAAGAGYFFFLRPASTPGPPTSQAASSLPPAETVPTAPPETAPAVPVPEATPVPEEEVTVVPGATPRPKPSPLPSPSTRPGGPSPSARPGSATPPPITVPPQQAAAAVRVAGLMAQAQSATTSGNYDAAIAQYDEVLKLDPQNPGAQAGKASAVTARTAAKKGFVTGRTVVQAGKAKANLSGFDTSDVSVQKAPDFSGRLEFSVTPSRPKPGDSYTLQVTLVNDGKKAIKLSGMSVSTVVNGARTGGPMAPRVREVAPQQRAVLEELPGVWPPDVATWSTEVQVNAGKDESLKGQVSWR